MIKKRCYLFALEVKPMEVGGVYKELPLHCTLMHRFWSEFDPETLANKVDSFFSNIKPIKLKPYAKLLLGPKQVPVSEIKLDYDLKNLHMELYEFLNSLKVEYTAPEWVGEGYRAHATERDGASLEIGHPHLSKAVYLIEVKVPGYEHKRLVRHKIELKD